MYEVGISQKITKPTDCVLGFGIPTSKESFLNDPYVSRKDFANKFFGLPLSPYKWAKYYDMFIETLEKVGPNLVRWGVTVIHQLTLYDFGKLFSHNEFDVIILFSHWKEDMAELYDGLFDASTVISQVPKQFSGIIDLCVCHPERLAIRLREERPCCLTKYIQTQASARLWLYFYETVFKLLSEQDLTYLEALEKTVDIFRSEILR